MDLARNFSQFPHSNSMTIQTAEFGTLNSKWAILRPNSYIQTGTKWKFMFQNSKKYPNGFASSRSRSIINLELGRLHNHHNLHHDLRIIASACLLIFRPIANGLEYLHQRPQNKRQLGSRQSSLFGAVFHTGAPNTAAPNKRYSIRFKFAKNRLFH
jgi:hypothetical protein